MDGQRDPLLRRLCFAIQQPLWWLAGGVGEHVAASDMPGRERKRQSFLGATIIFNTCAAGVGWYFEGLRYNHGNVAFLWAGVGATVVFLFEQLIVLAIHPGLSGLAKTWAVVWRACFGVNDALILIVPFLLSSFSLWINSTIATDERDQIAASRAATQTEFMIPAITRSIETKRAQIDEDLTRRTQYSFDVNDKISASQVCNREYAEAETKLRPLIASDESERRRLQAASAAEARSIPLEQRIDQLNSRITQRQIILAAKHRTCTALDGVAGRAVSSFQEPFDTQIKILRALQVQQQQNLETNNKTGDAAEASIEVAIRKSDVSGLVTDLRGLVRLVETNGIALALSAFSFWTVLLWFMTPVILKLSERNTDPLPKSLEAQAVKFAASRDIEIAMAKGRVRGVGRYCEEEGPEAFAAEIRDDIYSMRAQADVRREAEYIRYICTEIDSTLSGIAETAADLGDTEAAADVLALRAALLDMVRRANTRPRKTFRDAAE